MKKIYSLGYLRTSIWTKISQHKNKISKIEFIFSRHYTNRDFIERIESTIIFTKYQELIEEWMKELIIFESLFHFKIIIKSRRFSNCRSQTRERVVPVPPFLFPTTQSYHRSIYTAQATLPRRSSKKGKLWNHVCLISFCKCSPKDSQQINWNVRDDIQTNCQLYICTTPIPAQWFAYHTNSFINWK